MQTLQNEMSAIKEQKNNNEQSLVGQISSSVVKEIVIVSCIRELKDQFAEVQGFKKINEIVGGVKTRAKSMPMGEKLVETMQEKIERKMADGIVSFGWYVYDRGGRLIKILITRLDSSIEKLEEKANSSQA